MPRTTRTTSLPVDPAAARDQLAATTTDTVRGYAGGYRPKSINTTDWASMRPFVELAVLALAPASKLEAGKVGWMAAQHVQACLDRGTDRTVPGVWASDQVEHTLASKLRVGDASRASLASVLRRASRLLVPAGQPPRPARHPRWTNSAPYDTDSFADLLDAVTTLAAPLWRARATLLVALGAGAGITNADAALLEPGDLTATGHGLLVHVRGSDRARTVPVRHELEHLTAAAHTALAAAAAEDRGAGGRDRLFPGQDAASRLFGQLTWPPGVDRPNTHRLRATWSALTFASGCGVPAYLRAAHITSVDSWYATVPLLPDLPFDEYCAQVRGTTAPFVTGDRELDGRPWPAPAIPLRDGTPAAGRNSTRGRR